MDRHAPVVPMSKQDEDLLQLTLQLRNKKENDEKYAKFRGDHLIGVSELHFLEFTANGAHRIQSLLKLACGEI